MFSCSALGRVLLPLIPATFAVACAEIETSVAEDSYTSKEGSISQVDGGASDGGELGVDDAGNGENPDGAANDGGGLPVGKAGIAITMDGRTFVDHEATARRDGVLGGGGYNGITYILPTSQQLAENYSITFKVHGATSYLGAGEYPCQEEHLAYNMPVGASYFSVRHGTSYYPKVGKCTVHVSQATTAQDGRPRIIGTITGTLFKYSTGTHVAVTASFDLTYNN